MPITLPQKNTGKPGEIPDSTRRVVIIGANGAGKSRFTGRLFHDMGERAFRMSALNALYSQSAEDDSPSSIDTLYRRSGMADLQYAAGTTQLERLLALLMHDEMLNLISYKVAHAENPDTSLRPTRLDTVIALWREIFPGNKILIESGKFLFSRGLDSPGYDAVKLSAGERTIIYYIGAILYAPHNAVVFIDSPDLFLHPSILQSVWNRIELLRPDCTFVYTTHDLEFASSRTEATVVWVRDYDPAAAAWDYDLLPPQSGMPEEIYMTIIGARKPVLFIEGDGIHSIDSKLYPLVFKEYTVKSLGSCNKVIEATRTFNDLNTFHHMASCGIVDRDRRDEHEVEYLRGKKVMVPEVAEIENILMLEDVIRTVARRNDRDETRVFEKVKHSVMQQFRHDLRQQALMHTRHRVKRLVEYRIDGRFTNINMLEEHMRNLPNEINPRGIYENLCREFRRYVETGDYGAVLRVYNQKSMLPASNVAGLCGMKNKDEYLNTIIGILRSDDRDADRIRRAVVRCFGLDSQRATGASRVSETSKKK